MVFEAITVPRADAMLLSVKTTNLALFVMPWTSPASKMYLPGVDGDAWI